MINIIIAAASRAITDRKGVTAAEYAVLATGIVVAVVMLISAAEKLKVANKAGGDTFSGVE